MIRIIDDIYACGRGIETLSGQRVPIQFDNVLFKQMETLFNTIAAAQYFDTMEQLIPNALLQVIDPIGLGIYLLKEDI